MPVHELWAARGLRARGGLRAGAWLRAACGVCAVCAAVVLLAGILLTGVARGALAEAELDADEDISLAGFLARPQITVTSPARNAVWGADGALRVEAEGRNVARFKAVLTVGEDVYEAEAEGDSFLHTFQLDKPSRAGTLVVTGYGENGDATSAKDGTVAIAAPKSELIERMIALAYANSKDARYKFAPAEEDHHIGVCKNFVMRLFDTFSADYRMAAYPELALHMPKNNSKVNCNAQGYDYGIEWRPETAVDGSPFEIAASFRYDKSLSKQENAALARKVLESVQKGDFFQMVGNYGGGNGPHSLYFIADYDPETDKLHWTDSNMKGKRVDGVRYGYLQYDADATAEWFVNCINMRKRGCTLYRLRDDLYRVK